MNKELINTVVEKHQLNESYRTLSQEMNTSELTRLLGHVFATRVGGIVDWTQTLLSDKKERLLISGFGAELFCKLFLSDRI